MEMNEKQAKEFLTKARKGTVIHTEITECNDEGLTVNVYYQGNLITSGNCKWESIPDDKKMTVNFEKDLVVAISTYYHNDPDYFKQESALFSA
jgi:hypothetical protein